MDKGRSGTTTDANRSGDPVLIAPLPKTRPDRRGAVRFKTPWYAKGVSVEWTRDGYLYVELELRRPWNWIAAAITFLLGGFE